MSAPAKHPVWAERRDGLLVERNGTSVSYTGTRAALIAARLLGRRDGSLFPAVRQQSKRILREQVGDYEFAVQAQTVFRLTIRVKNEACDKMLQSIVAGAKGQQNG